MPEAYHTKHCGWRETDAWLMSDVINHGWSADFNAPWVDVLAGLCHQTTMAKFSAWSLGLLYYNNTSWYTRLCKCTEFSVHAHTNHMFACANINSTNHMFSMWEQLGKIYSVPLTIHHDVFQERACIHYWRHSCCCILSSIIRFPACMQYVCYYNNNPLYMLLVVSCYLKKSMQLLES